MRSLSTAPAATPTLWQSTATAPARWPQLTAPEVAEVAIVGAGVAGLSLALHLAHSGIAPIVLEAHEEGAGATGKSAGLVVPYLTRHTPASVQAHYGRERANKLLQLVSAAASYTFELIGAAQDECGAMRSGFLAPVRGASAAEKLKLTVSDWRSFRGEVTLLDAEATAAASGCRGYRAALFDPSGGAVNPLAYARFLAREAVRAGAALFTNSRVVELERVTDGWRLRTARAQVEARVVILCANGGNGMLHPALARATLPMAVTQAVTRILPASLRGAILPRGGALTDLEADVFSIRYDGAGRLITAYPDGNHGALTAGLTARVNQRLGSMLTAYRATPLEFAWEGVARLNRNLLPQLCSLDADLFAVQACNGRGLALNTIIGRELARWLAGGRTGELVPPLRRPEPIPHYFLARRLPNLLMSAALTARRLRGWLE